jgi:adenylyltransferase/sulfurtransferase
VFINADVGKNKAEALKARLNERILIGVTLVEAFPDFVTAENIEWMIPDTTSIVFLCVDSVNARLMINDYLVKKSIPFINGGTMEGRIGEVCTVLPGKTACLRCYMKPDPARTHCTDVKNPSVVGNSMLVSSMMIIEFQNWIMGVKTTPPVLKFMAGREVPVHEILDEEENDPEMKPEAFYHVKVNRNPGCTCNKK